MLVEADIEGVGVEDVDAHGLAVTAGAALQPNEGAAAAAGCWALLDDG